MPLNWGGGGGGAGELVGVPELPLDEAEFKFEASGEGPAAEHPANAILSSKAKQHSRARLVTHVARAPPECVSSLAATTQDANLNAQLVSD
jgi:hypothetical protein